MNVIAQGYKYREFGLKRYKMNWRLPCKGFFEDFCSGPSSFPPVQQALPRLSPLHPPL
jgi:hypothetical protein